jgi:sugar/nucleoside kinase (ribokinase family)
MPLLILGTVAYDTITTPFGSINEALGGPAVYAGLSAAHITQPCIVGPAGEDFKPKDINLLNSRNINTTGLQILPGKTFRWGGRYSYDLNSRETLFTELNVLENYTGQIPEGLHNSEYVFLSNFHPKIQADVLVQTKAPTFVAMDTMNFWIESAPASLLETMRLVDCLIINDSEARQLTEEHNIFKAAKKILELMKGERTQDPLLIIKRGEYGLVMFQGEKFFNLPAYPLEDVMDPTGAGDSFAGGFMGFLAETKDLTWENLKRACVTGSILASFCVEKLGTERLANLTSAEITARIESFKELTRFDIE